MTENAPNLSKFLQKLKEDSRRSVCKCTKLPSEYDLAKEYNCSRLTIRKAIDDLIRKNILVKRHGKGSYVMSQAKIQSGRAGLQGFTEPKLTGKSQTEVISFEEVVHPAEKIREALRMLEREPMTVEKFICHRHTYKAIRSKTSRALFLLNREERRDCLFASRN